MNVKISAALPLIGPSKSGRRRGHQLLDCTFRMWLAGWLTCMIADIVCVLILGKA